jgi:hypothetical protein
MKLPYRIRVRIRNVIDFLIYPIIIGALWGILASIVTKSVIENNAQCKQNMEDIADKLHEYINHQSLIEKIQTK